MNETDVQLITILLAANTLIGGMATALLACLFSWMIKSISRAHERLDDHTKDHSIHSTINLNP